jgi:hypothetical protein
VSHTQSKKENEKDKVRFRDFSDCWILLCRREDFTMMFSFQSSFAVVRRSFVCRSLTTKAIERPFRILGLQQIAIGSEKSEPLTKLWQDIFGLEKHSSHRIESENVEEDIIKLGPAPYEVEIDLMRPIDPDASPKV